MKIEDVTCTRNRSDSESRSGTQGMKLPDP